MMLRYLFSNRSQLLSQFAPRHPRAFENVLRLVAGAQHRPAILHSVVEDVPAYPLDPLLLQPPRLWPTTAQRLERALLAESLQPVLERSRAGQLLHPLLRQRHTQVRAESKCTACEPPEQRPFA